MVTVSERLGKDQPPPAYTESASSDAPPSLSVPSGSSSPVPTPPLGPPTNFLTIVRNNNSIKGGYTIDPSMPMPPSVVPSVGEDGKQLNMRVASQNGSIVLVVELAPNSDAKGLARLQVDSQNGSVTVTVHDKRQNRFRLKVTSKNGAISVRIPLTYVGTVSTSVKNSSLTLSPGIQARLTTFSEQDNEGFFFIGDYPSSGYQGDETWFGDHLRVESANGRVMINFVDEESEALSLNKVTLSGMRILRRR